MQNAVPNGRQARKNSCTHWHLQEKVEFEGPIGGSGRILSIIEGKGLPSFGNFRKLRAHFFRA